MCVCVTLVEDNGSTKLSDGLEGITLRVAVWKGNLSLFCYFMSQGSDVNIPITIRTLHCTTEFQDKTKWPITYFVLGGKNILLHSLLDRSYFWRLKNE